jgi:flagellar motor protein MotB
MLSFADMMTNLLCFFILMAAFATVQEGLQFEDWLGSIRTALDNNGRLNALEGHQAAFQFGAGRVIFRAASPVSSRTLVEEDGRILDANRDALRNVVVDAMSQPGRVTLPTPILFEPGASTLSAGHRAFLDEVAPMLATGTYPIRLTGFAFEEGASEMDGWAISEARARHAKEHLVARGLDAARITVVGFGVLHYGPDTRVGATPLAQNRFGRRAVIITLLEEP